MRTDWSGQIVQTQIRLLLEEQSDQGLYYLQYCDALLYGKTTFSSFRMITAKFSSVRKFRNFTVICILNSLEPHIYIVKEGFTGVYIIFAPKHIFLE